LIVTDPEPVPQRRSVDSIDQYTVHSQHLANPDGALVGDEATSLKSLLGEDGRHVRAINNSECGSMRFELKCSPLKPAVRAGPFRIDPAWIQHGQALHVRWDCKDRKSDIRCTNRRRGRG